MLQNTKGRKGRNGRVWTVQSAACKSAVGQFRQGPGSKVVTGFRVSFSLPRNALWCLANFPSVDLSTLGS